MNSKEMELAKIIAERIELMLSDVAINTAYQSMPTKEEAEKFIYCAAVATLMGVTE